MSLFNTTAKLLHRTPLPPGIARETAIAVLHDHDVILRFDPEMMHYEALPAPDPNPRGTKAYKVTDHMPGLPKGLWGSTVTFEAHITDDEHGGEYLVKAPLGLVQVSKWTIEPATAGEVYTGGQGGESREAPADWCLVEDVEIRASRFLVGTVKSKCEASWKGIHQTFVTTLIEVAATTSSSKPADS